MARALVVDKVVSLGDVQLAADDGAQASFLGLGVEFQRAVHGPVIRDRHGVHAVFFRLLNQVADADRAVEHGILRVNVQVGEGRHGGKVWADYRGKYIPMLFKNTAYTICNS